MGPESPMLYTKLKGNQPASFREDFFTIYGLGGHPGHMTRTV